MQRVPDPSTQPEGVVRYRYPEQLSPEQQEEMRRSRVVDADAYLEWLETGEGPEPCGEFSG